MKLINPRISLALQWDSYLLRLDIVREHNKTQDAILAERGVASFIEMPIYDSPLEMAAGGVWQKNIQVIR